MKHMKESKTSGINKMGNHKKSGFKKILLLIAGMVTAFTLLSGVTPGKSDINEKIITPDTTIAIVASDSFSRLYDDLNLDSFQLSKDAYTFAVKGYKNLVAAGVITKPDILSIIDFSLPSSEKRLFILDMHTGRLLFNTYVSHGRNSGIEQATKFSNDMNSFQSSLGFYVTGKSYKGEHGFSLKLAGLEKGINDNALDRGIVIHAAKYVNEKMARKRGYIGRSLGCPAIPVSLHRPIIQKIKDGSCLFLYGPDTSYTAKSVMMNGFRV
jgi:hypothetical protein